MPPTLEQAQGALKRVGMLASGHAVSLDEVRRGMLANAWVGGGAPRFLQDVSHQRHRLQGAFQSAVDAIATLIARLGGSPAALHVASQVSVGSGVTRGAFRGIDVGKLLEVVRELELAAWGLPGVGSQADAELAALGLSVGAGRTIGQVGGWADGQARDLRARITVLLRDEGDGLFPASLVAFGLFGASAPDPAGLSAALSRAVGGDVPAIEKVLELQRTGRDPTLAARVSAWWQGLDTAARSRLTGAVPGLIGALNGVPSADRDRANKASLAQAKSSVVGTLQELDATKPLPFDIAGLLAWQSQRDGMELGLRRIRAVEAALAEGGRNGRPSALLLGFDLEENGHAIVSYGNPDTADNVHAYVPGTGTTLEKSSGDFTRAVNLWEQARRAAPSDQTASIAWLGYDAPQLGPGLVVPDQSVAGEGPSDRSAPLLAGFVDGLRATHEGSKGGHLSLVGHSYGSHVVGQAAVLRPRRFADDLIFVGSPGVGVVHAGKLGMDPQHVWVGESLGDPITEIGMVTLKVPLTPLGIDPGLGVFGARRLPADARWPWKAHSAYWQPGSKSLRNFAFISTGQDSKVN